MKKALLKVFGVAALAAGMMFNVQMSDTLNSSDISLAALGNVAVAQSENPTAPGDSTKRGSLRIINGERHPCAAPSTNYC